MESIEKLRAAGRNMAKGRNLENHEECNLLLVIADEIEAEISEKFVELPCDAEGVPIRPREEVSTGMGDNGPIGHLEYWYQNHWVAVIEYKPGQFTRYDPAAIRHAKPRTLEDVLRECVMQSMTVDRVVNGIPVLGIDETMFGDWIAENEDELRELLRGDAE